MTLTTKQLAAVGLVALALPVAWMALPRDPLAAGLQLSAEGDLAGALEVWTRGCEKGSVGACVAAARVRLGQGDVEASRALVGAAKARDPHGLWPVLLEGRLAEVEGRFADAKAAYEEAERLHPRSGSPPASLARLALRAQQVTDAERAAERAIAADPELGESHAARGHALVATSAHDAALASYEQAIRLGGLEPVDWLTIAGVLEKRQDWDLRRFVLEQGVLENPAHPGLLVAAGNERLQGGDPRGAVELLRRAAELAPGDLDPKLALGTAFFYMRNYGFAAARLEEARALDPKNVEAAHLLAATWGSMKDSSKALPLVEELLAREDLTPAFRARTLYVRARLHEDAGRPDEAMADVREILRLEPDQRDASWLCGHIELERERLDEAEACLRAAAHGLPNPPGDVLLDLARLEARRGRSDQALLHLRALAATGQLVKEILDVHPELRALERNEEMKMLLLQLEERP